MMEKKDNSAALFKNDRKETANHPDYKGSALIEGREYWISAWIKPMRDGQGRFMSLAFTPKQQAAPAPQRQQAKPPAPQAKGSGFDDMDSDVPW